MLVLHSVLLLSRLLRVLCKCRLHRCLPLLMLPGPAVLVRRHLQDPPGRTAYLADATQVPRHPRRPTRSVHRRLLSKQKSLSCRLLCQATPHTKFR